MTRPGPERLRIHPEPQGLLPRLPNSGVTQASCVIGRSADHVWRILSNPQSVADWHPVIEFVRIEGDKRIIELVTGEIVVDRVDRIDARNRTLRYSMIEGQYAGSTHIGVLTVRPLGSTECQVAYTVQFSPLATPDLLAGSVRLAVNEMANLFGPQSAEIG